MGTFSETQCILYIVTVTMDIFWNKRDDDDDDDDDSQHVILHYV